MRSRLYCASQLVHVDAVLEHFPAADYADRDLIAVETDPIRIIVNVTLLDIEIDESLQSANCQLGDITKVTILTCIEDQPDHHPMLAWISCT